MSITLKAFGVLYDAGHPLSLSEIVEPLIARLDAVEMAYCEAWCLRRRDLELKAKPHKDVHSVPKSTEWTPPQGRDAVRRWLMTNFLKRAYPTQGQSLVRTADKRYTPGPKPPRLLTADGALIPFTPEARIAHEEAEQTGGRTHALLMEWDRCVSQLNDVSGDARLLVVMFLARRFAGILKTAGKAPPVALNEKRLAVLFDHLLAKADAPAVRRAILGRTLDWVYPPEPTTKSGSDEH